MSAMWFVGPNTVKIDDCVICDRNENSDISDKSDFTDSMYSCGYRNSSDGSSFLK